MLLILIPFFIISTTASEHPLSPLNSKEISQTTKLIQESSTSKIPWIFTWITLEEPEKSVLLPYFLNNTEPIPGSIPRRSFSIIINPKNGTVFEVIFNLGEDKIESWRQVEKGLQPLFAFDELDKVSKMLLNDELVQKRLFQSEYCVNLSLVVPDVWKYGYDGDKPEYQGRRMAQAYFYVRRFDNDNYYAHPMGFIAVIDTLAEKVVELEELPINDEDSNDIKDKYKIPLEDGNFDPLVLNKTYREISMINIEQPNGPNFIIDGNHLEWGHFGMRFGVNGREGLVLHNINYNDKDTIRPLIYRTALSEVFIPYGDPRPPYHRKMPFDAGEYGIGFNLNEISSPTICKGSVYYLNSTVNLMSGSPKELMNTICIYEEDSGIAWTKKDAINGKILSLRSQRLVFTFIATLSNYDYQMKWMFYPDASIRFEVTLTGIVDTNLATGPAKHGTILRPNLNAQFHQHFFVVRIDVDFDGVENSVSVLDAVNDEDGPQNKYRNGFHIKETKLKSQGEARTMTSPYRSWKIQSKDGSWKLIAENGPTPFLKSGPMHAKSAFTDYSVWVTPYKDKQLYAGGFYLNNSGLPEWVGNDLDGNIEDTDIVLWHVFGLTHICRKEDFPIMPSETIGFWLKPFNFLNENPAMDLRPS